MKQILLSIFLFATIIHAATPVNVPNLDFEKQLEGWENRNKYAQLDETSAHTGKYGLHIVDNSTSSGSNIYSSPFPVKQSIGYKLTFWGRRCNAESQGTSVYIRYSNANGPMPPTTPDYGETVTPMDALTEWKQTTLYFIPPRGATSANIWIHSANGAISDDSLDDFELFELSPEETRNMPKISRTGFPAPAPARISEIVAMLDDTPQGLGYPASRRDKWDHLPNTQGIDRIIANAEKYLATEPPELKDEEYMLFLETGDRNTYQKPYFERRTRLYNLAVAEAFENKGRFLPGLERDINAILVEKSWVLPAHDSGLTNFKQTRFFADLFASERASDLSTVDWWFQDKLKPETRAGIRRECQRRVIGPYLNSVRTGNTYGHGWMWGNGNWNAVCTGNIVNCILTLVEDKQTRAEVLAASEFSDTRFLSGFPPDGYCSEGLGYWGYGFGHYLTMGEHILQVTHGKLNIFDQPGIEAIAAFAKNIQIQDGIAPAFADCGVNARPHVGHLALIQRHWPQALNKKAVPDAPLTYGFPIMPFVAFDDESQFMKDLPDTATYPIRSEFPDAGIYLFRQTDTEGRVFGAVLKGGHNAEHHNHNDVGSLVVTWNGSRLVVDPGGETYTRQTFSKERYTFNLLNSFGHSVPVVAGKLQSTGRKAKGTFIKKDFSEDRDELILDFAEAYDVPELKTLTRRMVFDRAARTVTITDHVVFSEPRDFSTALVSSAKVHELAPNHQLIFNGKDSLDVQITATGDCAVKTERIIRQFDKLGPNRIGIAMSQPVLEASITMTMKPCTTPIELFCKYQAPDVSKYTLDMEHAITVQAEDFTAQQSENDAKAVADTKVAADGTALKLWDAPRHAITWQVQVPQAGKYLLQFKGCTDVIEGATRLVKLDDKDLSSVLFPYTGGWSNSKDDWRICYPTYRNNALILNLKAGTHTLQLVNDQGQALNLDWFKLIPVK